MTGQYHELVMVTLWAVTMKLAVAVERDRLVGLLLAESHRYHVQSERQQILFGRYGLGGCGHLENCPCVLVYSAAALAGMATVCKSE